MSGGSSHGRNKESGNRGANAHRLPFLQTARGLEVTQQRQTLANKLVRMRLKCSFLHLFQGIVANLVCCGREEVMAQSVVDFQKISFQLLTAQFYRLVGFGLNMGKV